MIYTSMMQMLQEEDKLCREIQDCMNILEAAKQVEDDGIDVSRHEEVLTQASLRMAKAFTPLHEVRCEIGGRLMMLTAMAEDLLMDHLHDPKHDGR